MAWLKLDDRFAQHPKIRPLSDRAFRLHVVGMLHTSAQLGDGKLTEYDVEIVRVIANKAPMKAVEELVSAGLWHKVRGGGYEINDYLKYNPSAEKVKAERQFAAERQARSRAKRFGSDAGDPVDYSRILERDGLVCHICGRAVDPERVHFDHVIPISKGGIHCEDNIKVAHVRCNLSKGSSVAA